MAEEIAAAKITDTNLPAAIMDASCPFGRRAGPNENCGGSIGGGGGGGGGGGSSGGVGVAEYPLIVKVPGIQRNWSNTATGNYNSNSNSNKKNKNKNKNNNNNNSSTTNYNHNNAEMKNQYGDDSDSDDDDDGDGGGGGGSHRRHNDTNDDDNDNNDGIALTHAPLPSDTEEGFLSTSPDSVDDLASTSAAPSTRLPSLCVCQNAANCVNLKNIVHCFKAPLSEEQAWALIYQSVKMYRAAVLDASHDRTTTSSGEHCRIFTDIEIPESLVNLSIHRDGSIHCSWNDQELDDRSRLQHDDMQVKVDDNHALALASRRKILRKLAIIIYTALDYHIAADEQYQMSEELEELITHMAAEEVEDCIDEGIDEGYKHCDDDRDDDRCHETKEFDFVLQACRNHVKPTVPDEHYKAVCRALVTETLELRIFLQQVLNNDTENLRIKAGSQASKQELSELGFSDWARFWVQVIDELRRGVRLKKSEYSRAPIEYQLTPYEILMEDIRSKKYQLRKVMVNGDIPPRVKKDAHALILEFIRSRPPLKKASERQLPPPVIHAPTPREQLMDSIRKGHTLKHVQTPMQSRLKDRLLPPPTSSSTTTTTAAPASASSSSSVVHHQSLSVLKMDPSHDEQQRITPRSKQRLIKVDFSLLQDDDTFFDDCLTTTTTSGHAPNIGVCSQPKMPPYPIGGYIVNEPVGKAAPTAQLPVALSTRLLRRTTYDLATQCESRQVASRRHTIVGCQNHLQETHSMPPSRPDSRQSDVGASGLSQATPTMTKVQRNTYNMQQQQQHQQQQQQQHQHQHQHQPQQHHHQHHHHHHHQQQQQQQQHYIKRSQSPSGGSGSNVSIDGGGGGDVSSNCSRSSSSIGPWNKSFLDEKTWHERGDDRLSLTLEEIVHIRSVMTKAELEGLPVGVRVKEDVEKRKVCFLCLRTRFSIFGPWGIQCKLCQRTVCSKCYTKMRLPVDHFRNVPLVLISPSLLSSPAGSGTPSPSHHACRAHSSSTGNILDETFPKSLIERLLRSESDRKARNTVGSAPSSPKHQRSNSSTIATTTTAAATATTATTTTTMTMTGAVEPPAHNNKENRQQQQYDDALAPVAGVTTATTNKHLNIMSRSVEGPRSLPVHSPARPHSNSSTLDRKSKFTRAFALYSSSGTPLTHDQKENVRGETVPVCHDCKGLVMEITRSSKQTRSTARNRALQNLTLDLSPVYK